MTPLAEVLPSTRSGETRLVAGVCFAHLVSHYYMVLLAPLFIFIRADYGVSYTELGLALTAFNVLTSALQTPTGFLVDRVSARIVIICGLLLGAGAFAIAGLVHSFWVFVAMFAVAGTDSSIGIMQLAEKLRSGVNLPDGVPTSLDVQHVSDGPNASTFPNGCHVCEVEVDPETGVIEVSEPAQPASPQPFTPSGLVLAGTSWLATEKNGASLARGIA